MYVINMVYATSPGPVLRTKTTATNAISRDTGKSTVRPDPMATVSLANPHETDQDHDAEAMVGPRTEDLVRKARPQIPREDTDRISMPSP